MKPNKQKTTKLLEQAAAYQQAGDLQRAIDCFSRYLKDCPGDAEVLHTLGGLYYQQQNHRLAVELLEQAHRADPGNLDYLNDLGAVCQMTGDYQSAITHLTLLVERTPGNHLAHYNLGLALHGAERLAEAIAAFEQAITLQPDNAPAHYNLGVTYQELGHAERAEECYRKAIRIAPTLTQAHLKLGEVLTIQSRDDAALEAFQRAYALDSNNPKIIIRYAESLPRTGRTEEGIKLLQNALKKHPQLVPLLTALGTMLHIAGQIAGAETVFRRALSLEQDSSLACLGFSWIRKFSRKDADIINDMEALLENKKLQDPRRVNICFALGKIYDDCKEYDQAFSHYSSANAIQHKLLDYDRQAHEKYINNTISVFTEAFFAEFSGLGTYEERPIFIAGMPRSGTTLTEQILVSHPCVADGGELAYFHSISNKLSIMLETKELYPLCCRLLGTKRAEEIIRNYLKLLNRHSTTARFVTDKLPQNFLHLGLIRVLFPKAPIIHCRRDPLDVCLSIFFQYFSKGHDYAFDLMDLGHYYLQYARLMAHWRNILPGPFMESRYEDLIANQEARSRELVNFCGLDWDNSCLAFYQKKRDVKTVSNWQVRQPIYSGSVKRWENYAKYLEPLRKLFEDAPDEL